ncbi:MAG: discoidin domain-containing protein, partial [Pseudomonadota bacterium]
DEHKWLQIDLGEICTVNAVQLNYVELNCKAPVRDKSAFTSALAMKRTIEHGDKLQYILEGSDDGEHWTSLADKQSVQTDRPHDLIVLDNSLRLRFLRLKSIAMPFGGNFAVSGFRVFGKGNGPRPERIDQFTFTRDDPRTAVLNWHRTPAAVGYNIRWGIHPDKLYSSWMVYGQAELSLGALTKGADYWIAIDAFNENGVTKGKPLPV